MTSASLWKIEHKTVDEIPPDGAKHLEIGNKEKWHNSLEEPENITNSGSRS